MTKMQMISFSGKKSWKEWDKILFKTVMAEISLSLRKVMGSQIEEA